MSGTIIYPRGLKKGDLIAITAPSSGVEERLHHLLLQARLTIEALGYKVIEGKTIRTNEKCTSAPKEQRASELQSFLLHEDVKAVIPPWGGEFLMEILPLLNWELLKQQQPKWVLGYSDISTFNFAYTLLTGTATAHGTNYIDLSCSRSDVISSRWTSVLSMEPGGRVEQASSKLHLSSWNFSDSCYQLDTPTKWKILGNEDDDSYSLTLSGRLIGGCLDTLSILIGTPYAPLKEFSETYCKDTGMLWYLESCEMNAADIYRHLWQMKQCGWFENTTGFLFGRPDGYSPTKSFELTDALHRIFDELHIPVIYDVDIGHIPPQLTLINGAYASVASAAGTGTVTMTFS